MENNFYCVLLSIFFLQSESLGAVVAFWFGFVGFILGRAEEREGKPGALLRPACMR